MARKLPGASLRASAVTMLTGSSMWVMKCSTASSSTAAGWVKSSVQAAPARMAGGLRRSAVGTGGAGGQRGVSKQNKGHKSHRPRRVDYWHDPAAPKPTSRKPSASVIVRNSAGDLLLRRSDSGRWTIPTGGLKKNETLTQCAVRECHEETGLDIEITGLVGVFSDPGHVIAYAGGEVRQPVNACFAGRVIGGNLTT